MAVLVLAIGVFALCVAFGAEHFLGMAPCPLCLWERWPYRALVLVGAVASSAPPLWPWRRPLLWLTVLILLCGAGIAFLHVGVEFHWWPSPLPECNAPNLSLMSVQSLSASLPSTPSKPCDAPNYLIPGLPISFAAMDLILAAVGAVFIAAYLVATTGRTARP